MMKMMMMMEMKTTVRSVPDGSENKNGIKRKEEVGIALNLS